MEWSTRLFSKLLIACIASADLKNLVVWTATRSGSRTVVCNWECFRIVPYAFQTRAILISMYFMNPEVGPQVNAGIRIVPIAQTWRTPLCVFHLFLTGLPWHQEESPSLSMCFLSIFSRVRTSSQKPNCFTIPLPAHTESTGIPVQEGQGSSFSFYPCLLVFIWPWFCIYGQIIVFLYKQSFTKQSMNIWHCSFKSQISATQTWTDTWLNFIWQLI